MINSIIQELLGYIQKLTSLHRSSNTNPLPASKSLHHRPQPHQPHSSKINLIQGFHITTTTITSISPAPQPQPPPAHHHHPSIRPDGTHQAPPPPPQIHHRPHLAPHRPSHAPPRAAAASAAPTLGAWDAQSRDVSAVPLARRRPRHRARHSSDCQGRDACLSTDGEEGDEGGEEGCEGGVGDSEGGEEEGEGVWEDEGTG
ncbi:hypothetical protein V498_03867 [Pseudogymnoascus sp. VKM F-4517 (FW-2822)]|nr:hypothetical protein V498_03867 [Pseudogymnoascus sp. VKM F-4517 (FW-2822)]